MEALQLQRFLDDADYLNPFQSGLRLAYGMETALVVLVDDLRRDLDRGSVPLLLLLHFGVAFSTIDHGILLEQLSDLGLSRAMW